MYSEDTERDQAQPSRLPATSAEVSTAVTALSAADLLRLRKYAAFRIRGLGARARGHTHQDLLSEALTLTLAGERRWRRDQVDLVGHLLGVMRSISSHWAESSATFWTEANAPRDADTNGWNDVPSSVPDAERHMAANQELARIQRLFADDPAVLALIEAIGDGLKGPEIQQRLGLTKTDYETIFKRLRRGVQRMAAKEDSDNA